jgi:hypothetical protein
MSFLVLLPAVLMIFVAFTVMGRRHEETPGLKAPEPDDGIDRAELERAEREVREMEHDGSGAPPEQAQGDDWGPGVPRGPVA